MGSWPFSAQDVGDGGKDHAKVAPRIDIAAPEPLIRIRLLDRNFQLAIKGIRYDGREGGSGCGCSGRDMNTLAEPTTSALGGDHVGRTSDTEV